MPPPVRQGRLWRSPQITGLPVVGHNMRKMTHSVYLEMWPVIDVALRRWSHAPTHSKKKRTPYGVRCAPIVPRYPRSIAAAASAKNRNPHTAQCNGCVGKRTSNVVSALALLARQKRYEIREDEAAGIRTHRLLTQSALSSTYSHQNEKTDLKGRFRFGGSRWIRTTEGIASRFTVCPLWPLGNTPI